MKSSYLRQSFALAVVACVSASAWAADNGMELKSETDKTSYALGYQIGGDFQRQRVDLNEAAVVRGIADARAGAASLMSEESMRATLIELKRKVVEQERAAMPQIVKGPAVPDAKEAATGNAATALPHAKRAAAKTTEVSREFFEKNCAAKKCSGAAERAAVQGAQGWRRQAASRS